MQIRCLTASLLVWLCAVSPSGADGMVYQLPEDGVWATFALEGSFLDPDGKEQETDASIKGTLTISSVGTVEVEGVPCRWIEIVIEAQRDGTTFKEVDKLLIPAAELGAGKQPLKHVRDAWYQHTSVENGKPQHIPDISKLDGAYVERIRPILHPPFTGERRAGKKIVECKLGKVDCETVEAEEIEKYDGSDIQYQSSYVVYLHEQAPFGVAAWQTVNRVRRGERLLGTRRLLARLADFGKGARTCIAPPR